MATPAERELTLDARLVDDPGGAVTVVAHDVCVNAG